MIRHAAAPMTAADGVGRIRFSAFGLLCFLTGCTAIFRVNVIGAAYLAELLLPVLGLLALFTPGGRKLFSEPKFWILFGALMVTLSGYMLSDFVRDTSQAQYVRGWGRIGMEATDFLALALIAAADRRNLWWFIAGFGAGGVLYLRLVQHVPLPIWKFGYAEYMTLGFAAFAYFIPARWASIGFVVLGYLSLKYDFRIHTGVCLLIAAFLWLRAGKPRQRRIRKPRYMPLLIGGVIALGAVQFGLKITEDDYSRMRREGSDVGREAGIKFGIRAVLNSPIVGYGSWGVSSELFAIHRQVLTELGAERGRDYSSAASGSTMSTHSEGLQAWVEGGLLGAVFFFVFGYQLFRSLKPLVLERMPDAIWPILLYFVFYSLWHLFMSPFAATSRLQIAFGAVAIVVLAMERTRAAKTLRLAMRMQRTPVASASRGLTSLGTRVQR